MGDFVGIFTLRDKRDGAAYRCCMLDTASTCEQLFFEAHRMAGLAEMKDLPAAVRAAFRRRAAACRYRAEALRARALQALSRA